jgi:hypothetical protein
VKILKVEVMVLIIKKIYIAQNWLKIDFMETTLNPDVTILPKIYKFLSEICLYF